MDLSTLQSFIGSLTNDPGHDRYSLSDINAELDNTQDFWNVSAKIIKDTVTITTVGGTRQYDLSGLTGTPIAFTRVTHKGIDLLKKDKSWFDLYSSYDWSVDTGTPKYYYIEVSDPDSQYIDVYPIPAGADAGANLVLEYVKRHTPMSASTDMPFNSNSMLVPYHHGVGYDVAFRLLMRDPSTENSHKMYGADGKGGYKKMSEDVLSQVVDTFKAMEREEPMRLRGGKRWGY